MNNFDDFDTQIQSDEILYDWTDWSDMEFVLRDTMVKAGDKIRIYHIDDPYVKEAFPIEGKVTSVDDMGQIHGTWGGWAVCAEYGDVFEVVE